MTGGIMLHGVVSVNVREPHSLYAEGRAVTVQTIEIRDRDGKVFTVDCFMEGSK